MSKTIQQESYLSPGISNIEYNNKKKKIKKNTLYIIWVIVGILDYMGMFLSLFTKYIYTNLLELPVPSWTQSVLICSVILTIIIIFGVCVTPFYAKIDEQNYQIYKNSQQDLECVINLNDEDSDQFTLCFPKDRVFEVDLNKIQREYLYKMQGFKTRVQNEIGGLHTYEIDVIKFFKELSPAETIIEELKFKIDEEKKKIDELSNPDLLLIFPKTNLKQKIKIINSLLNDSYADLILDNLDDYFKEMDKPESIKSESMDSIEEEKKKNKKEEKEKGKKQEEKEKKKKKNSKGSGPLKGKNGKFISKEEIDKEENNDEDYDDFEDEEIEEIKDATEQNQNQNQNSNLQNYEKLIDENIDETLMDEKISNNSINLPTNFQMSPEKFKEAQILLNEYLFLVKKRIELHDMLEQYLLNEQSLLLVKTEGWKTYMIQLSKPIKLVMNWKMYPPEVHTREGSTTLFITCPGTWKECFSFPDRWIFDNERESVIKMAAALPTFDLIEPIYTKVSWLIVDASKFKLKTNYNICVHLSQLRDMREDIIKWMSYSALQQSQELKNKCEEFAKENESIKTKMDDLKAKNIEKWVDEGEFPNFFINRELKKQDLHRSYWIVFSICVAISTIVGFFGGFIIGGR